MKWKDVKITKSKLKRVEKRIEKKIGEEKMKAKIKQIEIYPKGKS